ncbi:MAG TPA: hypothetical protein VGB63_04500 [Pedobacter sp.]|jgi:hypothetical protein
MKYFATIEIDNSVKQVEITPALYMEVPLWEVTIDDRNYIIKKCKNGSYLSVDSTLPQSILDKIGDVIESLRLKDTG